MPAGLPLSSNLPFNMVSSHYLASILARGRDGLGGSCSVQVHLLKYAPHSLGSAQLTDTITEKIVVLSQLNATHIPPIGTAAGIISERRALVNPGQVLVHNPTIVIIDQVSKVTSQVFQGLRLILTGYNKTMYTLG